MDVKRRRRIAAFCILVVSFPLIAASAHADLVTNGSFETPVLTPGTYLIIPAGSPDLAGWTVLGTNILVVQTTYSDVADGISRFNALDGVNSVDLTGAGSGVPGDGVSQTISTTAGVGYLLSFGLGLAFSSNGSGAFPPQATLDLAINGGTPVPFTNSIPNPGQVSWETFVVPFVATGSSTTIAFYNGNGVVAPDVTSYIGLDAVGVTVAPTPEPSSFALVAVSLPFLSCPFWLRRPEGSSEKIE
jgi:hypothetical protein